MRSPNRSEAEDDREESQSTEERLELLKAARILMVDDDPLSLATIEALLANAGYGNFVGTTDPRGALETLAEQNPDALLLDLNMPAVSGFDFLKSMRSDRILRHLPVLVLTSSNNSETKLECLELGATDFLAKPVDPSELVLRLRNTLAAKAYQDRLAFYDALTGLPNRRMFLQRLSSAVEGDRKDDRVSAVLHFDLDRFQQINDSLGLVAADGLLKEVGGRLVECVRASDLIGRVSPERMRADVSRLGGDEFSVLLTETMDAEAAGKVAQRILRAFERPFVVEGQEIVLTASMGIAVFPEDAEEPEGLLRCATTALAHAKDRGRNTYQFYSSELNTEAANRLALTNDLRKGLGRGELVLWYQPKVDVATGEICGAEALVRWQHPVLGLLFPDSFIPLAEESGLVIALGEWVLCQAALQHQQWREAGLGNIRISVNISGDHFKDPSLPEVVAEALKATESGSEALCIELTETVVMGNAEVSIRGLEALREMGVKISIDDFGTGYSSLSYLKLLPIDELKIDRSFVSEVHRDENDRAIAAAIIAMARTLGLRVVAEGVETEGHLEFLQEQRCEEYQGYFFSRPVVPEAFAALLTANRKELSDSDG